MGVKFHTGMDEPRLQRVADNGHAVHSRIQAYLKESGILVDAEVPVHDEKYEICGHCDGIIRGHVTKDDNLGVLEIKSINETGFRSLYKPKPEHVGQISLYMFLLDLKWGCLLYENKNDQRLTEFLVNYDKRNVLPLLDRIKFVRKYIKIEMPPPKDPSFPFCDWCDHSQCV
jgi:CRISPR/Cas system-associated exonuclease Cas4 (RecB family)